MQKKLHNNFLSAVFSLLLFPSCLCIAHHHNNNVVIMDIPYLYFGLIMSNNAVIMDILYLYFGLIMFRYKTMTAKMEDQWGDLESYR